MIICDVLKLFVESEFLVIIGILFIVGGFVFGARKDVLGITTDMDTIRKGIIIGAVLIVGSIVLSIIWTMFCPATILWAPTCSQI
jgi:hypothetical protein